MSFPQKVRSALWAIVDTMACNTARFVKNPGKDFTRDRKLGFVQLIHFFLCMGSGCISHELLKYFYFLPDEVPTASAFIQQRARLLPETFRHIPGQFNLRFPAKRLMGKYSLIAADGCEFNILPGTRRILPPSIPQAAGQTRASTRFTRFLCMTCFPGGIWMWSSSRAGSKTNLPPSAG